MEVREPSARYLVKPGFKQTEVGVIPSDWEVKSLSELGTFEKGKGLLKGDIKPYGSTPAIPYTALYTDFSEIVNHNHIQWFVDDLAGTYVTNESCLLVASSSNMAENTGKASALVVGKPVAIGREIIVFKSSLNPIFVSYLLSTSLYRRKTLSLARGTTIKHVYPATFHNYKIALPSQVEQEAIAEALSDADALIEALEQLLAKKRQIKQGAMQELLTGQKRLPGFSGKWEETTLGDIAERVVGGGTPSRNNPSFWNGNIPWMTVKDFANFSPLGTLEYVTREGLENSASHLVPQGTLITSTRMAIGKAVIFEVDVCINQDLKAIQFRKDINPKFMYFWFLFNEPKIAGLGSGSTVMGISLPELKKLCFLKSGHIEQTAIATILSDMDTELVALETKLAKARQLKQGMMQELLTGRIRLVQPKAEVIAFPVTEEAKPGKGKSHNWQINEAVVISVLAKHFGSEQWPLGRKRYTKLSYLLHRHVERQAEGYLKKAAGPYNPATKYGGPEGIALKNAYVRQHAREQFSGFVAGERIGEAEVYFREWYGDDVLVWLEQFRLKKNEDLELLATVDMAMEDLRRAGSLVVLDSVKEVIRLHPEWQAKLDRPIFSDDNIERAIIRCNTLFGEH